MDGKICKMWLLMNEISTFMDACNDSNRMVDLVLVKHKYITKCSR